jgi:hypothetical protein
VQTGSPAIGRSVAEAGLRGLDGVYLTSVKRGEQVIHAVGPDFIVLPGDILFFAGDLPKVNQITQRFKLRTVTDAFEEDLPALMGSPTAVRAHHQTVFTSGDASPSLDMVCTGWHVSSCAMDCPTHATMIPHDGSVCIGVSAACQTDID